MSEQTHKKHVEEGEVLDKKPASAGRTSAQPKTVVYQFPNKPLLVAIIALLLSGPLPGFLGTIAYLVGIIALARWSYLEVEHGVNGIRRFFGWLGCMAALYMFIHLLFY